MSSLNELGIIPECDIARADERARQRAEIEALKAERDEDRRREYGYSQQTVDALTKERDALRAERDALRAELHLVLDEWNELVKASGSPTNGGAIGHVRALRAERDALRTELASMRACFEAADPLRSELRERAKRARQAALIEAAEICDRHANEWPQTIAAVLRATAKEKGND